MKTQLKKPRRGPLTLTVTLAISFFALSAVVLLISTGLQTVYNVQTQQETIVTKQVVVAQNAGKIVSGFIQEKLGVLQTAARLIHPVIMSPEEREAILASLLGLQPAFRQVALLDTQNRELAHTSRLSEAASYLGDQLQGNVLVEIEQRKPYISPVYIDGITNEPMVIMSVPATNVLGDFQGTLVAEVNLKFMWDLIDQIKRGETGEVYDVYVVDRQGNLIAYNDMGRVLKGENVRDISEVAEFIQNPSAQDRTDANIYTGIQGTPVLGTYVPLEMPNWAVMIELPRNEAYRKVILQGLFAVGVSLGIALLAGLLGVFMARRLAVPLVNLMDTANRITAGEQELQADVAGPKEVASLAVAFNSMTGQLRQILASLEERIADRTHRLEIVASLGERLNAILDPDNLLRELVNQVKQNFGYYHTQIYLLDDSRQNLVVAAGTGRSGEEMVANGHHIALPSTKSLVAQAARTRQIARADNVQESLDWLSNPLLPETRAEMAVPIIREHEVIGVLDVQADRAAALDESDANLLRSLASQVAVALSNARLFEQMTRSKEEAEQAQQETEAANKTLEVQMWQTTGQAQLNDQMRGEQNITTLARNVTHQLCQYLGARVGALYILEGDFLRLAGSYAYTPTGPRQFCLGEGLVGQAALEKRPILLDNIPDNYLTITSGLGETGPRQILVAPFAYDGRMVGVVELATLTEFGPLQMNFLPSALESVAIAFTTAQARQRVNELLAETQQQAEILQAQEEELRAANEELEAQAESLRASEARLKSQQAELQDVNAALEEKAEALEKNSAVLQEQQAALDQQNRELTSAQATLQQQAAELARASQYKSEFLANMSHELRTPLNSLLILAGMLSKNEPGNLTPDQVESVKIIHGGGIDLLNLINEILDLSKVEAGRMEFHFGPVAPGEVLASMRAQFGPVAATKGLLFETELAEAAPARLETDQQRLEQILKNLLSNAFKFTSQGQVRLVIEPAGPDEAAGAGVAIRVSDTGIGMTPEQQQIVFEAFQQADGSTSRHYGGTGLGLTISRELAARLGGQLKVTSEPGRGTTFTLYLPLSRPAAPEGQPASRPGGNPTPPAPLQRRSPAPARLDDREQVRAGERLLLIIEDDARFARVAYDYAHRKGFKCLLAGDGETGLALARSYPLDAIILDLNLPGMSGWDVLAALKEEASTRHVPVHIMSVADEDLEAYKRGAMGFLTKPVSPAGLEGAFQKIEGFIERKIKSLLVVEDDDKLRKSVRKLLEGDDVLISEAGLGQAALEQLAGGHFDCMILDLTLPDMSGFELLNRLDKAEGLSKCPVIVYTGQALSEEENRELLKYADSVIVKGVKSPERLLDETALFLHRVIANLPAEKQQAIKQLHSGETGLAGKQILIVDDDARNAFALSRLLAGKGLTAYIAPSGARALELLAQTPIDLVLMDIMMPGMDGYETTRQIRQQERFRQLPVLALTAKAMQGDREKCLAAGANDYLSKPVEATRLFSMLRVWLSRA